MTGSQVIDAEEDRHKLVVEYKLCNLPIFITISNSGASALYSSFPILNLMTGAI